MYFDRTMIILLPAILISLWAQYKVSYAFQKYSKVCTIQGYTGAEVARKLLDIKGLHEVPIELIQGKLTDHYDPVDKIMRLSHEVYYGNSVAAVGVAAHETGHAIQHLENYSPLVIRNSIVPVVNFSSRLSWIMFLVGLFFSIPALINIGIVLFCAVVLFQLITLPVEFNASNRALVLLESHNILYRHKAKNEIKEAKAVLDAAAMTYVAAAITAIAQLLRLIVLSNRNND